MKQGQTFVMNHDEAVEHLWNVLNPTNLRLVSPFLGQDGSLVSAGDKMTFLSFSKQEYDALFGKWGTGIVLYNMWLSFLNDPSSAKNKDIKSIYEAFKKLDQMGNFPTVRFIFDNGDEFHLTRRVLDGYHAAHYQFSKVFETYRRNCSDLSKLAAKEKERIDSQSSEDTGAVALIILSDFVYGLPKWQERKINVYFNPKKLKEIQKRCKEIGAPMKDTEYANAQASGFVKVRVPEMFVHLIDDIQ